MCSYITTAKANVTEGNPIRGTLRNYCALICVREGWLRPCPALGDTKQDEHRRNSLDRQVSFRGIDQGLKFKMVTCIWPRGGSTRFWKGEPWAYEIINIKPVTE